MTSYFAFVSDAFVVSEMTDEDDPLAKCSVSIASTPTEIIDVCRRLKSSLDKTIPVLGLDCEWRSPGLDVGRKRSRDSVNVDGDEAIRPCDDRGKLGDLPKLGGEGNGRDSDCVWMGEGDSGKIENDDSLEDKSGCDDVSRDSEEPLSQRVSLLQLSTSAGDIGLIRLCFVDPMDVPDDLIDLLSDPEMFKVGVNVNNDANKLFNEFGISCESCLDLRYLYRECDPDRKSQGLGLKNMSMELLGMVLDKNPKVIHSNWDASELSPDQIRYAALDAFAGSLIFDVLISRFRSKMEELREGEPMTEDDLKDVCRQFCDRPFRGKSNPSKKGASASGGGGVKKDPVYRAKRRDRPFYDNHQLEASDGEVLTRLGWKKLVWYVYQGIADLVSVELPEDSEIGDVDLKALQAEYEEERLERAFEVYGNTKFAKFLHDNPGVRATVRLRFEPKARSAGEDAYYTQEKENKCVVCGTERDYFRKHVIPPGYLKRFPHVMKSHRPHDVLLLCQQCHVRSNMADQRLKDRLAKEYDAPLDVQKYKHDVNGKRLLSAARVLKRNLTEGNLPKPREEELKMKILECLNLSEWNDTLLDEVIDNNAELVLNPDYVSHEEKVMDAVAEEEDGFEKFEQRWRKYFLTSMKPRFMPALWSVTHNTSRRQTQM